MPRGAALLTGLALVLAGCGGENRPAATSTGATTTQSPPAATGEQTPPAAPAASRPGPRLIGGAPCPSARGFTCATLGVPLDRARPGGERLRLKVAAQDVERAPHGVLLVLTGGPGQPGVPFAARSRQRLGAAARGYRLVLLDQRGTGAGALRCPALQTAMGTSDLTVPPPSAVTDCARRLGDRRTHFTTADTVADLDDLRAALGADRLALLGTSYGTFVAARYALAHPDRTSRLVLDSVVPHQGLDATGVQALQATGRVLRMLCRERDCPSDPARDLAAVVRRDRNGSELLDTLTALSVGAPSFPGVLPALRSARRGDRRPLQALVAAVRRAQRAPASVLSQGLHQATLCADSRFPWPADAPVASRPAALARARATARAAGTFPFDAATATGNGFVRSCLPWPPVPRARRVAADLPPVPVLLLAGGRDLSTPLAWARREAAHVPRGRLVVAPRAGHGVLRQEQRGPVRRALVEVLQGR